MGLWLLANTVGRDAAELRLTNNGNGPVGASESVGIDVLRGGPRSLKWVQTGGTDARKFAYINKSGLGAATHCVVVDAAAHGGANVDVIGWEDYTSDSTVMHGAAMTPLVGIDGSDWVFELTTEFTAAEAYGITFPAGYEKTVRQVYFCNGLEFSQSVGPVPFTRVPVHAPAVQHCGNFYKLHATAALTLGPVTRAKMDKFYSLPLHEPVFLYDDTGEGDVGDHLPQRLWHCILMGNDSTVPYQDNTSELLFIDLDLGILKHGNG